MPSPRDVIAAPPQRHAPGTVPPRRDVITVDLRGAFRRSRISRGTSKNLEDIPKLPKICPDRSRYAQKFLSFVRMVPCHHFVPRKQVSDTQWVHFAVMVPLRHLVAGEDGWCLCLTDSPGLRGSRSAPGLKKSPTSPTRFSSLTTRKLPLVSSPLRLKAFLPSRSRIQSTRYW